MQRTRRLRFVSLLTARRRQVADDSRQLRELCERARIAFGVLVLLFGSMFAWHARIQRQVADAKLFCESLLPLIQQARSGSGSYPANADAQWWAGRPVPALIRTQTLYHSYGKIFVLSFRDPSAFWYDIWAFDSRWMKWLKMVEL